MNTTQKSPNQSTVRSYDPARIYPLVPDMYIRLVQLRNGLPVCISSTMREAQITQARKIARTIGVLCAAQYMRKRGWSVESTAHVLLHGKAVGFTKSGATRTIA